MIKLNRFDEFGPNMGLPSMKDFFSKDRYPNQDLIVDYLRNKGKATLVHMNRPKDVFTGEYIECENVAMNDGKYSWNLALAYYVEKYNLQLNQDFIKHVLKQTTIL